MAVRIKDWMIPYTWGQGIEITNNHVINVLLRELNNLIMVNEDRELYVDLQLPDWIEPDDDFPVGVTTWKILQEDWWTQSWIILNWKTTSWDYVRFIYANDNKLYYDPWTWVWIEIWTWWWSVQINVATASTLGIIKLGSDTQQTESAVTATSVSGRTYPVQLNADNQAVVNIPWTDTTYTGWQNVTITNGEINVTLPNVLVYKGTVNDLSDLPSSWQSVWDTYFVEWEDWMYSWDWTQWSYVWWTWIDTSNFFDKTIDTSDDITQGTTNLFVTQQEKTYWNWKQDALTAGDGIDLTNNVISNTKPFEAENQWALWQYLEKTSTGYKWNSIKQFNPQNDGTTGQVLKKTSTGYEWEDESWWGGWGWGWWGWITYTGGDWINVNNSTHVITNTKPFEPWEWTVGQVLTKTADGYEWETSSGNANVKLFTLNSESDSTINLQTAQEAYDWLQAWKLPIVRIYGSHDYVDSMGVQHIITGYWDYYPQPSSLNVNNKIVFNALPNTFDRVNIFAGYSQITDFVTTFTIDDESVTEVEVTETTNGNTNFLGVWINYSTPYIPEYPWSPATKKYVDDKNWIWTQLEFDQLWTYENWVIYNILPNS